MTVRERVEFASALQDVADRRLEAAKAAAFRAWEQSQYDDSSAGHVSTHRVRA
jgi:hypothetical protein